MIHVPRRQGPSRWLSLLVLLLGLAAGVSIGLTVSWLLWPVEYVDVAPDSLKLSHREQYLLLISQAYRYDEDRSLATVRLAGLDNPAKIGEEVADLAQKYADEGRYRPHTEALTSMAYALGHPRASLVSFLPAQVPTVVWAPPSTATPIPLPPATPTGTPTATATDTPTATPTRTPTLTPTGGERATSTPATTQTRPSPSPTPSQTPRPTRTPTATAIPEPRYEVIGQARTCAAPGGLLRVTVHDDAGRPVPNVELLIRWDEGEDRFYTGLKPDVGEGYADFKLDKGVTYQLGIVGTNSEVATGIVADMCVEQGHLASWDVLFQLNSRPRS